MSYPNYLSSIIKNSGLSLRKIAYLCEKKHNVSITASYLSKLQKEGNKNPASEKVNTAVAKVCGTNPDDLNFEAELERAPETVKEIINELVKFVKKFFLQINDNFCTPNKDIEVNIESEINKYVNMSTREFLQALMQYSNLQENTEVQEYFNPLEMTFDLNKDNVEELLMKFSIDVPMIDNSMFPIIKQGAKLELVKLEEYKNGDIVSVNINNNTTLIRTYVESEKNIILIPVNQEFDTLILPKKDITINGKVKSYRIDL